MTSVNRDVPPDFRDIGHLLWTVLQRARTDGLALIAAEADVVGPVTASHARLLDRLPPEGARVTELAARVRITKQALGQLATQLADRGYVEVVADPADGRARLIRCTPRGECARRAIRAAGATLDEHWRADVGERRYAIFREVLAELAAHHMRAAPEPP